MHSDVLSHIQRIGVALRLAVLVELREQKERIEIARVPSGSVAEERSENAVRECSERVQ